MTNQVGTVSLLSMKTTEILSKTQVQIISFIKDDKPTG